MSGSAPLLQLLPLLAFLWDSALLWVSASIPRKAGPAAVWAEPEPAKSSSCATQTPALGWRDGLPAAKHSKQDAWGLSQVRTT